MNLSGRVQICRRACSNKCCGIKSGKREREREVKKDFSKSNIEVNLITQWCCRFSFVHSKQLYLFQCTYRNGILPNSTIPLCNSTNRSTMLLDPYLSALQHVFLPVLSHLTIDELTTQSKQSWGYVDSSFMFCLGFSLLTQRASSLSSSHYLFFQLAINGLFFIKRESC